MNKTTDQETIQTEVDEPLNSSIENQEIAYQEYFKKKADTMEVKIWTTYLEPLPMEDEVSPLAIGSSSLPVNLSEDLLK